MKRPVRMEVHLDLADGINDLDVARVLRAALGPAVRVHKTITMYGGALSLATAEIIRGGR